MIIAYIEKVIIGRFISMKLVFNLICLYAIWYTLREARIIWIEGQKFSSICILVLALIIAVLTIYLNIRGLIR